MNHEAMHNAMFWVGAMFVFTPLVTAGIVIGVWWWGRRRARPGDERAPESGS